MKYRKKPVVIEAVQWTGDNWSDIGAMVTEIEQPMKMTGTHIRVYTAEGVMTAALGDWIIKGIKGEFYPCKPDIFAETYEPVTPEPGAGDER